MCENVQKRRIEKDRAEEREIEGENGREVERKGERKKKKKQNFEIMRQKFKTIFVPSGQQTILNNSECVLHTQNQT